LEALVAILVAGFASLAGVLAVEANAPRADLLAVAELLVVAVVIGDALDAIVGVFFAELLGSDTRVAGFLAHPLDAGLLAITEKLVGAVGIVVTSAEVGFFVAGQTFADTRVAGTFLAHALDASLHAIAENFVGAVAIVAANEALIELLVAGLACRAGVA
jgi:hypothetical protein